ncbi:MAG: hypothetical protein P1U38_09705 [Aeromicrobium sp.]|uniref:hypothetical protein n=1 Tax=Aeromicrobium sp. TaxID=1871063 RepID=UPI00262895AB|nr:hypothetical protein [Aeromicrobium sp.]MDF1705036.1 hypothetical protein [Aeromicrobium sp.]
MSLDSYVRTHASTWTDDDYRGLPQAAKALYTQLLSSPTRNTLGIGEWDLEEFVAFDPDTTPGSVVDAMNILIERRYVVLDRKAYIVRSYLRHNTHLIKNTKNARGLIRRFRETFSMRLRWVALHELHRLREEQPDLAGWPMLEELFTQAKFDYKLPSDGSDRATDPAMHRTTDRTTDPGNRPATDQTTDRVTDPIGRLEEEKKEEPSSSKIADAIPDEARPEVEQLCNRLADHVVANSGKPEKRPAITKAWRDAARLLLDRDNEPLDEVVVVLDWCQRDHFWHKNVPSMPTFRKQYDQLALKSGVRDGRAAAEGSAQTGPKVPWHLDPNYRG